MDTIGWQATAVAVWPRVIASVEMLMGHVPVLVLFPSLVGIVTIITIFHGAYVYFYIIYYVYTHADTCNIW